MLLSVAWLKRYFEDVWNGFHCSTMAGEEPFSQIDLLEDSIDDGEFVALRQFQSRPRSHSHSSVAGSGSTTSGSQPQMQQTFLPARLSSKAPYATGLVVDSQLYGSSEGLASRRQIRPHHLNHRTTHEDVTPAPLPSPLHFRTGARQEAALIVSQPPV